MNFTAIAERFYGQMACVAVTLLIVCLNGCADSAPVTFKGVWSGSESSNPHVVSIEFKGDEFPCGGQVIIMTKMGTVSMDVIWSRAGDRIEGTFDKSKGELGRNDAPAQIAVVSLSGSKLSGTLTGNLVTTISGQQTLPFSGFRKAK
jgi:hypothetical protein